MEQATQSPTLLNLIEEAQEDLTPHIRGVGHAIWCPAVLLRRWKRHLYAEGLTGGALKLFPNHCVEAIGAYVAFTFLLTVALWAMGTPGFVAFPFAALLSVGLSWPVAAWRMFATTYGVLYVSFNPDKLRPWQAQQLLRVSVPRLTFKHRQDDVFHGSYAAGYMRVEITEGEPLSELTSLRALFDMPAGKRQLNEAPLASGYSRMKDHEVNGLNIHATKAKSLADRLSENWGFIIGAIFLLIAGYMLLQMQEGELLMRPDIVEREAAIERMQAGQGIPPRQIVEQ